MADVTFKGTSVPTIQGVGAEGVIDSNKQAKLFEGIIDTVQTVATVGDNLNSTLIKQEEKREKEIGYQMGSLGSKEYLEYENSLVGLTGVEKEQSVLSKFSELSQPDVNSSYAKSFGANMNNLYRTVKKERISEQTSQVYSKASEIMYTESKYKSLTKEFIDETINGLYESFPEINKSVSRDGLVDGLTQSISEEILANGTKDFKTFDTDGKPVIKQVPLSLLEIKEKRKEVDIQLKELTTSEHFFATKSKSGKANMKIYKKRIEDSFKLLEQASVNQSTNNINVATLDKSNINSYRKSTEEMAQDYFNVNYSKNKDTAKSETLKQITEYNKELVKRNEADIILQNEVLILQNGKNVLVSSGVKNDFVIKRLEKSSGLLYAKAIATNDINTLRKSKKAYTHNLKSVKASMSLKLNAEGPELLKNLEFFNTTKKDVPDLYNNNLLTEQKTKIEFYNGMKPLIENGSMTFESASETWSSLQNSISQGTFDKKSNKKLNKKVRILSPEKQKIVKTGYLALINNGKDILAENFLESSLKENVIELGSVNINTEFGNIKINEDEESTYKSILKKIANDRNVVDGYSYRVKTEYDTFRVVKTKTLDESLKTIEGFETSNIPVENNINVKPIEGFETSNIPVEKIGGINKEVYTVRSMELIDENGNIVGTNIDLNELEKKVQNLMIIESDSERDKGQNVTDKVVELAEDTIDTLAVNYKDSILNFLLTESADTIKTGFNNVKDFFSKDLKKTDLKDVEKYKIVGSLLSNSNDNNDVFIELKKQSKILNNPKKLVDAVIKSNLTDESYFNNLSSKMVLRVNEITTNRLKEQAYNSVNVSTFEDERRRVVIEIEEYLKGINSFLSK